MNLLRNLLLPMAAMTCIGCDTHIVDDIKPKRYGFVSDASKMSSYGKKQKSLKSRANRQKAKLKNKINKRKK